MRSTAHQIGRAHHDAQPLAARRARRGLRGRKLGDDKSAFDRLEHVLGQRVVVTGERDMAAAAQLEQAQPVALRIAGLHVLPLAHDLSEVLVAPALIALRVDTKALDVHPLPLPRRVIHDRHELHVSVVEKGRHDRQHVVARELAAHVQQVFCTQQIAAARFVQRIGGRLQALRTH